jgi:hypothetical protein
MAKQKAGSKRKQTAPHKARSKRKQTVPPPADAQALEIVHPNAAGIDVGGSAHWVAISPDRDPEPVRCFGCFTADLHAMARWLVEKGVRSVACNPPAYIGCRYWKCWRSTGWKYTW